ncbi:beta-propeller domain-containing protein [Nocardioides marmoribigeumensis]|uniref:Beta propeller domain-containing protein n=1 Tax=Nocardioides marmoribigeumensis TaxID=433649 RepID=A0ABU2BZB0_9ACTN|nr:beta-propeller domain-containing protein [Nocardioides marmoribigeumensis]MDR7363746.1 hypothetical protein [Nocardioides marmoribigeumensis]
MSTTRRTALVGTTAGALGLGIGLSLALAGSPAASASPLPAFGGCDELLRWYVDRALPLVGPYGLGGGPIVYGAMEDSAGSGWAASGSAGSPSDTSGMPVPMPAARDAADTGQVASGTGTNVQETRVDEPDLAKTDGELVVRVRGDRLLVARVGDGPVGPVEDVGALGLPEDLRASELLLSGTRVLVVGSSYAPRRVVPQVDVMPLPRPSEDLAAPGFPGPGEPVPLPRPEPPVARVLPFAPPSPDSSRVVEVDLTDPAAPRVLSDRTHGGSLVSARQYDAAGGSVVRLVLHTGAPTLDFVQPNRSRSEAEATEANRRVVRGSTLADWLPQVRDTDGSGTEALLDCDEVRHPLARDLPSPSTSTDSWSVPGSDLGTLSIVTLPFSDPTSTDATGVTTGAETVYSSPDRLYVALSGLDGTTDVHAFSLDGSATRYAASGTVDGTVRDRWAMDEHDGVLRLAVALRGTADNGVVTLREDGSTLRQLGSVRGLGLDEEIKSVRWFDDLAVVVTFRQTDPLYTVDLRDPSAPRTLGALKVPGFSTYLHPIGGGRLLGVGQDASASGVTRGTQVSVFDLSDLAAPRRLSRLPVDGAMLLAEYDPRALTWLPSGSGSGGTVLAGASSSIDGRPSVLELRVGPDGSLARGRAWTLGPSYAVDGPATPRALPLGDGRVALVGEGVQVVRVP